MNAHAFRFAIIASILLTFADITVAQADPMTPADKIRINYELRCEDAIRAGKSLSFEVLRQQGVLRAGDEEYIRRHQVAIGMGRCAAMLAWGASDYPIVRVIEDTMFERDIWGYNVERKIGYKRVYSENMIIYKIEIE